MFTEEMSKRADKISAENEIREYLRWMSLAHAHLMLGDPTNVCNQIVEILNRYEGFVSEEIHHADDLRSGLFLDRHDLSAYDLLRMCEGSEITRDFQYFIWNREAEQIVTYSEDELCKLFYTMSEELAENIVKNYTVDHSMFYDNPTIMWILFKHLGEC